MGGIFAVSMVGLALWTCAWFYTMQPKVHVDARLPDGRDKRISELESDNAALRSELPAENSLKMQLLQAADEFDEVWRRPPKEPTCIQNSTMTPDEQRKAIEPCSTWSLKRETEYQQTVAPIIMGLIQQFKSKGGNVTNIENCAPGGFCGVGGVSLQLRAFSRQLDAQDRLKR
jgi:hypothetical protein